jgi:hypothetical protein
VRNGEGPFSRLPCVVSLGSGAIPGPFRRNLSRLPGIRPPGIGITVEDPRGCLAGRRAAFPAPGVTARVSITSILAHSRPVKISAGQISDRGDQVRSRTVPIYDNDNNSTVTEAAMSTPISQRFDEQSEGRRLLAAARVVKMIARKRLTPISQRPDEPTIVEFGVHLVLRQTR